MYLAKMYVNFRLQLYHYLFMLYYERLCACQHCECVCACGCVCLHVHVCVHARMCASTRTHVCMHTHNRVNKTVPSTQLFTTWQGCAGLFRGLSSGK